MLLSYSATGGRLRGATEDTCHGSLRFSGAHLRGPTRRCAPMPRRASLGSWFASMHHSFSPVWSQSTTPRGDERPALFGCWGCLRVCEPATRLSLSLSLWLASCFPRPGAHWWPGGGCVRPHSQSSEQSAASTSRDWQIAAASRRTWEARRRRKGQEPRVPALAVEIRVQSRYLLYLFYVGPRGRLGLVARTITLLRRQGTCRSLLVVPDQD